MATDVESDNFGALFPTNLFLNDLNIGLMSGLPNKELRVSKLHVN